MKLITGAMYQKRMFQQELSREMENVIPNQTYTMMRLRAPLFDRLILTVEVTATQELRDQIEETGGNEVD